MQETWVRSLGREDPLEEGMRAYGQRSLAGNSPWGRRESNVNKVTEHAAPQFP